MEQPTIRQGFVFRLRTKAKHEASLRRWDGCCRKIWNLALAEQQARYARGEKYLGFARMCNRVTAWRKDPELAYLKDPPVHVLQSVLRRLDKAYQDFFKKKGGYPKFKRYGDPIGLHEPDVKCFEIDNANGRVKFPKLGWIRYRKSRNIEGTPKNITIKRAGGGWQVSIQTERQGLIRSTATAIGAGDRGITNFLATDTGRLEPPRDAHTKSLLRLRRYQRACARKSEAAKKAAGFPKNKPFPKGFRLACSNRLKRAQARVAKMHCKIAARRSDFLHKLSTEIAKCHAIFCLEDLKVKNMSARARGNAEAPGKNFKQKTGLNRSILDQGWAMWAGQVKYKLERRGGRLVLVNPAHTSQKCSLCGHIHADHRKGEAFRCLTCGHIDHADVNAAKNILAAGLAVLAGDGIRPDSGCADVEDSVQPDRPAKRQPTFAEGRNAPSDFGSWNPRPSRVCAAAKN